jgi:hypothetical protein
VVMGKEVGEKISQRWTNLDEKTEYLWELKIFWTTMEGGKSRYGEKGLSI